MKFKKFTLLFALLLGASMVQAQTSSPYKTWSIGLSAGLNKSYTDVNQYTFGATLSDKSDVQPSLGLHVKKSLTSVFGVQFNLGYDRLQGVLRPGTPGENAYLSRSSRINRFFGGNSAYFTTPIITAGFDVHVNFSNMDMHYKDGKDRKAIFYGIIGGLGAWYNPSIKYLANDVELPTYNTGTDFKMNTDNNFAFISRTGVGVKFNMSSKIDLGFEAVANIAAVDFLDGIDVSSNGNDLFLSGKFTLSYKMASKTGGAEANLIDWQNPGKEIFADVQELNSRVDSLSSRMDNSMATADADGDGVYDAVDKEPYTPFGAKVDSDGKGIDGDGDGVYDGIDKEENTPAGKLVNFQGIEIKAPVAAKTEGGGVISGGGSATSTSIDAYFPSLFFDTGSARIRSLDIDKLVRIATALQQNATLKVKLVGNADVRGGTEFNENLAKRRAEAVSDYLVKNLGVDASRVMIESKGESNPLSPNVNNVNRRVDIMGTK